MCCRQKSTNRNRPLVVPASWETRESSLPHEDGQGVDADLVIGASEFALNVINRKVFFAHGDSQMPYWISRRSHLRAVSDILEKGASLAFVMPKLVAKNPKGASGVCLFPIANSLVQVGLNRVDRRSVFQPALASKRPENSKFENDDGYSIDKPGDHKRRAHPCGNVFSFGQSFHQRS